MAVTTLATAGGVMSKVRQVIRHVTVETARGERGCRRNRKHRIASGQPCLVIQEQGTPYKKSYCAECALPILKQCAADLRSIRDLLYGPDFRVKKTIPERQSLGAQLVEANRQRSRSANRMQVTDYIPVAHAAAEPPAPNHVLPIGSQPSRCYESQ